MLRVRKSFSDNALDLIRKRYFIKDSETLNVIEDEADFFPRIAKAIADVDSRYGKSPHEIDLFCQDLLNGMDNHKFIFAGRTLAGAGSNISVVPNCSVLGLDDSMDSIFQTMKDAALLQQSGVGCGFCFSALRPAKEIVKTAKSYSSGPISFLRVYNEAFRTIQQNNRHGANMATFSVDHPDILDFIRCKDTEGDINCFNVSVLITDEFMKTATNRDHPNYYKPWKCKFDDKTYNPRIIERNDKNKITDVKEIEVTAREIFDTIIRQCYKNGEPGIIFYDNVNKDNPLPLLGPITASNPCSEQHLHPGDICLLIAMNLGRYVIWNGKNYVIDYKSMDKDLRVLVRAGDNIIDMYDIPVKLVADQAKNNRRIGIGVMGFADMLIKLRVRYGSDKCIEIIEEMMSLWKRVTVDESQKLAIERGAFANWEKSIYFLNGEPKRRNAALTNIAPTGSISRIFECSSGLEPHFMFAYQSNILNMTVKTFNPLLKKELIKLGLFDNERIINEIVKTGSIQNIPEIPEETKNVFVGSMDITPEDHIRVQTTFQRYIDNAISKTINFPESASLEDIEKGYLQAWAGGAKGCTVYRNNSRVYQVLETIDRQKTSTDELDQIHADLQNAYEDIKLGKEGATAQLDSIMARLNKHRNIEPASPICSSSSEADELVIEVESPKKKKPYCLSCKSVNVVMQEKCMTCLDCLWSPCSS